jgi:hypothetical protein
MQYKEFKIAISDIDKAEKVVPVPKVKQVLQKIVELFEKAEPLLFVNGVFVALKWYQVGRVFKIAFLAVEIISEIVKALRSGR